MFIRELHVIVRKMYLRKSTYTCLLVPEHVREKFFADKESWWLLEVLLESTLF